VNNIQPRVGKAYTPPKLHHGGHITIMATNSSETAVANLLQKPILRRVDCSENRDLPVRRSVRCNRENLEQGKFNMRNNLNTFDCLLDQPHADSVVMPVNVTRHSGSSVISSMTDRIAGFLPNGCSNSGGRKRTRTLRVAYYGTSHWWRLSSTRTAPPSNPHLPRREIPGVVSASTHRSMLPPSQLSFSGSCTASRSYQAASRPIEAALARVRST